MERSCRFRAVHSEQEKKKKNAIGIVSLSISEERPKFSWRSRYSFGLIFLMNHSWNYRRFFYAHLRNAIKRERELSCTPEAPPPTTSALSSSFSSSPPLSSSSPSPSLVPSTEVVLPTESSREVQALQKCKFNSNRGGESHPQEGPVTLFKTSQACMPSPSWTNSQPL